MSKATDYSKILKQAYNRFLLPLGNKQVPTPYRTNIPFQSDRRKYGKSDAPTLIEDTLEAAKEDNFDLRANSAEQIRGFMEAHLLGIDCSGFVYWMLDYLLKQIGEGGMEQIGFPVASKTNVNLLTSDQFTVFIDQVGKIQSGDVIKFTKGGGDLPHILIIMEKTPQKIIYAHSSGVSEIPGVHRGMIEITLAKGNLQQQQWSEKLNNGKLLADCLNLAAGDGIRRLKSLTMATEQADNQARIELKIPYFSQKEEEALQTYGRKACGLTSLRMILGFYGRTLDISQMNQLAKKIGAYSESCGWLHAGLINMARELGLKGFRINFEMLADEDLHNAGPVLAAEGATENEIGRFKKTFQTAREQGVLIAINQLLAESIPVIVSMKTSYSNTIASHLIVIKGREDGHYIINDPWDYGPDHTITPQYLKQHWTHRIVVIYEDVSATK